MLTELTSQILSNKSVIMTIKHLSSTKIIRRKLWCQLISIRNTPNTKANKSRWNMVRLLSRIGTIIKQTSRAGINILLVAIKTKDMIVSAQVLLLLLDKKKIMVRLKSEKCPEFHWGVKSLQMGKTIWRISVTMSYKCQLVRKRSKLRSTLQDWLIVIASL